VARNDDDDKICPNDLPEQPPNREYPPVTITVDTETGTTIVAGGRPR
jgi:hypothetical protein